MFLTATNVTQYLLDRGLLSPGCIVSGDLQVLEAGRRNRNFQISTGLGSGLFVKQVPLLVDETVMSVRREAKCLEFARPGGPLESLGDVLSKIRAYDADRHVLVTELIGPARNLGQFHGLDAVYPIAFARAEGKLLARLHRAVSSIAPFSSDVFPRIRPWILQMAKDPDSVMPKKSGGNQQLAHCVRQLPELRDAADSLESSWRKEWFIHGDFKWDNVLVVADDPSCLRLLDLELADVGDPAFDVGCAMASYLAHWMSLRTEAESVKLSELLSPSATNVDALSLALTSLFDAYADGMDWSAPVSEAELLLSVRWAGMRLVQSAFEYLFAQSAMTIAAGRFIELSRWLLATPSDAVARLFTHRVASCDSKLLGAVA